MQQIISTSLTGSCTRILNIK